MKRPAIAVIGAGAWGMNHVRVWHELGHLQAVCDAESTRLAAVRELSPDIEVFDDLDALLGRGDVEAVVVATPPITHPAIAERAIHAGKDVLVEKPMALTVEEGEEIVRLARSNSRILGVGHVLEYHPAIRKLKELIEQGALGRIRYIYSHRLNFGRIRTEENALWSFAPHDIAIMDRLVGSPPDEVGCFGEGYYNHSIADVTVTNLAFPNHIRGHIFVSWLHPFKEHRLVVVGDSQMAVFNDTAPWPEKLVLFPHRVEWLQGKVPVARRAEAEPVPLEKGEPLKLECEDFARAVVERRNPYVDGPAGLAVLRVLRAAQLSLEQNGRVQPVATVPSSGATVHPTAEVDASAIVGAGTKIWHHSQVMPGAIIGDRCVLGKNVFIGRGVVVGDGVKIQNNVSVYEGVTLEDDVFCGPSMVFTNVMDPRSAIERKDEFRPTLVRKGATLGANSTIVCGNTIGRYAMVGAGAVVTRDVPDHALVTGVPARAVGWVCRCGGRLSSTDDAATCPRCGEVYVHSLDGSVTPARLSGSTRE